MHVQTPSSPRVTVRDLLAQALGELARDGFIPAAPANIPIERAKRAQHEDSAASVAVARARGAGRPPRAVAEAIVARLPTGGDSPLAEVSIAGPGLLHLRLAAALRAALWV